MESAATILTKEDALDLSRKGWRSPVEFCRIFLPKWFPTKMPWFHRGMAALRLGRTEFLLDFGPELWARDIARGEVSEWTVADLEKILTNFVIVEKEAVYKDGAVVSPEVTTPMFRAIRDDRGVPISVEIISPQKKNAFIVPRGFSKTTLLNALNLRDLLYQEEKFILYVSETKPHASKQVTTVRMQLEENDLLIAVFGNQRPKRQDTATWSDSWLNLNNGMKVSAVGSGGQVRGISEDAQRPTRIVVDDLQSSETMLSPSQMEKDLAWFIGTLVPAGQEFGDEDEVSVDMIGTLLGPQAIMALLMKDPDWNRVRFGAMDKEGMPLWAAKMDAAQLAKKRAQFERLGQLDQFDYEYMSSVPITDGVAFPLDKIIYVNRPNEWFVAKAVVCDPAISENPKADFCTIAAMGMGKFGDIHVIDFHGEVGMEFDAQAEKFFEFHFAHCLGLPADAVKHGVEAVAYQRALISLIQSKQHEKSKNWGNRAYFEVTPILHGRHEGSKIMRVQGLLSPRVKSSHFSMERPFQTLIGQLRDWPNGKKDAPDVCAMGIQLLDPYSSQLAMVPDENGEPTPYTEENKLPKLKLVRRAP